MLSIHLSRTGDAIHISRTGNDELTELADAVGVSGVRHQASCALGCGSPVPADQAACGGCE